MTANPLMIPTNRQVSMGLDAYCAWLNGLGWVRASGVPYHIAERETPNGQSERYLGRAA